MFIFFTSCLFIYFDNEQVVLSTYFGSFYYEVIVTVLPVSAPKIKFFKLLPYCTYRA